MELISPTALMKKNVLAVQDYALLSARSIGNLFRRPLYLADTIMQADLIGVGSLPIVVLAGGYIISFALLGLDTFQYWNSAYQALKYNDVITGLTKPLFFGFIIATIGCYYGLSTRGGTQGVGRSTTQAVVAASVLILAVDVVLTKLLLSFA